MLMHSQHQSGHFGHLSPRIQAADHEWLVPTAVYLGRGDPRSAVLLSRHARAVWLSLIFWGLAL